MTRRRPRTFAAIRDLPPPKWSGRYVVDDSPGGRRFVIHWRRILALLASLAVFAYLAGATTLWGYYSIGRRVPGVNWIDIAVPGRYPRVETALSSFHFAAARKLWEKKDFAQSILTARTAVAEDPGNLEARLFLAGCWRQAGRFQEAVRVLRNGIDVDAGDSRLQGALVQTCLDTAQYQDLLKALRQDFPEHGVRLIEGPHAVFRLAEIKAVLEISGSAAAEAVARRHPDLEDMPAAAPILSQIDWEMGRHQLAIDRLLRATKRDPGNFNVEDAYVGTELRMGKPDDARVAARQFLRTYPTKGAPQLHMLEAYGLRDGRDRDVWTTLCIRYLEQFRNDPAALGQLGSLAASNGWTDLAFVLYQESLQRSLDGFPFAIYYASSLVKAGDMAEADKVWNDLSIRNAAQLAEAPYVAAMVAWGSGRKSDAEPILASIRGQTVADLHRRRMIGDVFRSFGFAEMADRLAMP